MGLGWGWELGWLWGRGLWVCVCVWVNGALVWVWGPNRHMIDPNNPEKLLISS